MSPMVTPASIFFGAPDFVLFNPETVAPRRRRQITEAIPSTRSLVLDDAPFITTPNAALYHARLRDSDEPVVVKRLPSLTAIASKPPRGGCDDPLREIHVHNHIYERGGHPNIVRALGVVLDDDATHLVLEDCNGGDLFGHLQRYSENRLPQREALEFFLQIARGLQFLHQCNIAHRDVSVENVLLTSEHVCKLSDFGLSVQANAVSTATVGKAHYMAPEVVARRPHDPVRADLWSLGILLFILLTGSPLVKIAAEDASDFRAIEVLGGTNGVLKLWKVYDQFSTSTLELLDGLLQTNPETRFQTVNEVLDHPAMLAAATRRLDA